MRATTEWFLVGASVFLVGTFCLAWIEPANAQETQDAAESADAPAEAEGDHAAETSAADDAEHAAEPNPLSVKADLALWTAVVFVLLLTVLGKYAWPQITEALEAREQRIAADIAAAAAKHEDSKKLLSNYEAKLAAAADEVRAMLEEARRDAEYTKNQIVAEARQAASEERDRAVREVELAKDASMKELAERSAALAIDLAGRFVRVSLSPEQQSDIVRSALDDMSANSPSRN